MKRFTIGHPVRVIGMDTPSRIVGSVFRDGILVHALQGIKGIWPSWLVVPSSVVPDGDGPPKPSGDL